MKAFFFVLCLLVPTGLQAQVTYFATFEGDGTEANPFRAHSNIQGTECISLRANETQLSGIAFCDGPSLPVRAGIRQVDLGAPLTAQQKTFLATILGRTVTETTVAEALTALADANALNLKRWPDGKHRLFLKGREILSRPAPIAWRDIYREVLRFPVVAMHAIIDAAISAPLAFAASLSSTFTCADNASLNCEGVTWTEFSGSSWAIVGNTAELSNTVATNAARAETDLNTNSMLVGATITALSRNSATEAHVGLIARKENSATITYYYGMCKDLAGTDECEYGYVVTGSRTSLGTSSTDSPGVGDLMELIIYGDQLSFRMNGVTVLGPTTNSTIASDFRRAGIRSSGSGTADNTVGLDNWYARDYPSRRASTPLEMP